MKTSDIEKIKQTRWMSEYEQRLYAKSIAEINPKCKGIKIIGKLSFQTAVCQIEPQIIDQTLDSTSKAYFYCKCLNPDCTGKGFSLTNEIRQAVHELREISGSIKCDGKEDWKYIDAVGCSCMSQLDYNIIPIL